MNESNISLANVSNISTVNTYCKYDEPDTDAEKIAKRTTFVLLIVLGISLNIFVIILAAKFTVRKNLHHLIINMAVSDAIVLFIALLSVLLRLDNSTLHRIIYQTLSFLGRISFKVSLITLLIISIERFRATRQTLQRSRHCTLKQRVFLVGISWLIPIPVDLCGIFIPVSTGIDIISTLEFLIILLCSVAIIALSILTTRRLSKPRTIQANLSEEQQNIRKRRAKAAIRMVIVSALLYPICWLPPFVYFSFIKMFLGISFNCIDERSLDFILIVFLPAANSCLSPCIYIIFLPDFRQAAKKVLCRTNTLNQVANRSNFIELQPMPNPIAHNRGRRNPAYVR